MAMSAEQIRQVSEDLSATAEADGSYTYRIMEVAGPKGAALQQVVDLLRDRGVPSRWLSKLAVRFRLKGNSNPVTRPLCVSSDCPVHGWIVYSPEDEQTATAFALTPEFAAIQAAIVALNLSPDVALRLSLAEVFPSDLAKVRDAWIVRAAERNFPNVSELDIKAAVDTVNFDVRLGGFASLFLGGCRGSSCPAKPILASG